MKVLRIESQVTLVSWVANCSLVGRGKEGSLMVVLPSPVLVSTVAVTNCHKLSGLKQHSFINQKSVHDIAHEASSLLQISQG